ncbi:hypothetical protein EAF04_009501 [Stromatinia cepivora]|nr:hypothetical protein EAF04_009501 [Stromatinia cepivora]
MEVEAAICPPEIIEYLAFPSVNINKLSKKDTAIIHNLIFKHRSKNIITIYIDASSTLEEIGVGIGIVAISANDQITHKETNSIAQPGDKFKVYSDNQAELYRLKIPSDAPGQSYQIRAIKAAESLICYEGSRLDHVEVL